jgi:hypothetical protein
MNGRIVSANSVEIDPELTLWGQICCDAQLSVCSTIW